MSNTAPPQKRRLLRVREVMARTGLTHDAVYRGAREGWFPRSVRLSAHCAGWIESEVEAYIDRVIAERDAPKAPAVRPRRRKRHDQAEPATTPAEPVT